MRIEKPKKEKTKKKDLKQEKPLKKRKLKPSEDLDYHAPDIKDKLHQMYPELTQDQIENNLKYRIMMASKYR